MKHADKMGVAGIACLGLGWLTVFLHVLDSFGEFVWLVCAIVLSAVGTFVIENAWSKHE